MKQLTKTQIEQKDWFILLNRLSSGLETSKQDSDKYTYISLQRARSFQRPRAIDRTWSQHRDLAVETGAGRLWSFTKRYLLEILPYNMRQHSLLCWKAKMEPREDSWSFVQKTSCVPLESLKLERKIKIAKSANKSEKQFVLDKLFSCKLAAGWG